MMFARFETRSVFPFWPSGLGDSREDRKTMGSATCRDEPVFGSIFTLRSRERGIPAKLRFRIEE